MRLRHNKIEIIGVTGNLLGEYQDRFPLQHMGNKGQWIQVKKREVSKFHLGYISSPDINQQNIFQDQVIKFVTTYFTQDTINCIKTFLKNVVYIVMLYEHKNTVVYKVLG